MGVARLNKNGDNPTCQSGALLTKMDNADLSADSYAHSLTGTRNFMNHRTFPTRLSG